MPDFTPIEDLLTILGDYDIELVGSTAINGTGEDIDIAVRVNLEPTPIAVENELMGMIQQGEANERAQMVIRDLVRAGCTMSGGAHYEVIRLDTDDQFTSFRRGQYNILLCFNTRSWERFTKGRDMCIFLRGLGVDMTNKAVRVAVHGIAAGMNLEQLQRDQERLAVR